MPIFNFHGEHMSNQTEDRPYGADRASRHQVVSRSDSEDSKGGRSKESQKVDMHAPAVAPQKSESKATFDERLPQPKGAYPSGHTSTRCENGAKSKGSKNHLKENGY
jgi:hypothetical protein